MGNNESKIYFWDLQALEEYSEGEEAEIGDQPPPPPPPPPPLRPPPRSRSTRTNRHGSTASSQLEDSTDDSGRLSKAAQKCSTHDPFRPLLAHSVMTIPKVTFAARQVAWSVGGEWMVVVGDQGMIALFGR